jgi:hypothetical protein
VVREFKNVGAKGGMSLEERAESARLEIAGEEERVALGRGASVVRDLVDGEENRLRGVVVGPAIGAAAVSVGRTAASGRVKPTPRHEAEASPVAVGHDDHLGAAPCRRAQDIGGRRQTALRRVHESLRDE